MNNKFESNKIIIVWGMPLTIGNVAQTTCAFEKYHNLLKIGATVKLISPNFPRWIWKDGSSNWLLLALYQPLLLLRLLLEIKKEKPNVIHSSSPLVIISLIVCRITKIDHVVEAHGVMFEEAKLYNSSSSIVKLMKCCEMVSYSHSSIIIANAIGTKIRIEELFNTNSSKIVVIPNGANIDIFKPMKVSKSDLGLAEEFDYICFVGNLLPWQGVQYLIESAPIVINHYPKVKFLIVGSGMMEKILKNMVIHDNLTSHFIFTGLIPYNEVPKYINVSILCVAPFIKEKDNKMSPLKILEYMACGKPVITTNVRGAGDVVNLSGSGIVVSPDDPKELASAICKLLSDPVSREVMGKNGRSSIAGNYSWAQISVKINEVYSSLINH